MTTTKPPRNARLTAAERAERGRSGRQNATEHPDTSRAVYMVTEYRLSDAQACAATGISRDTLRRALLRRGIRRPKGSPAWVKRNRPDEGNS